MLRFHLKGWAVIGVAVVFAMLPCRAMALADESRGVLTDNPHYYQKTSDVLINSFFLNFSQRYYRAVESSLRENSYFAFRYYLNSPFDSFDKQQFILENPTQANDLAQKALHNTIRKAVEDIELLTILREYVFALTNLQMRIGSNGARLHGPSMTRPGFRYSTADAAPNDGVAFNSGLTFADDLRLGLKLVMEHHLMTSRISYYPTSRNEIGYTAETQLTAFSKIGMSYHMSQNNRAVATTLSVMF